MTTSTDIDHSWPDQAPDPALDARAAASLGALFGARPAFAADLEEAGRAHTHLEQERQREADARDALTRAEQHASGMTSRLDLTGRRFAGFTAGAVAVAILLVFDTIPLNWAAQAFGLAAAATWLVTGIMLVASAGAMAGLELTREDARRRGALLILVAAGFAALAVLRTAFLVTVAGESLGAAILQAVLLSAISAGWWRAARWSWPGPGPGPGPRAGRGEARAPGPRRRAVTRAAGPRRGCSCTGPCCSARSANGRSCRRSRPGRATPTGSPRWSAPCVRFSRRSE